MDEADEEVSLTSIPLDGSKKTDSERVSQCRIKKRIQYLHSEYCCFVCLSRFQQFVDSAAGQFVRKGHLSAGFGQLVAASGWWRQAIAANYFNFQMIQIIAHLLLFLSPLSCPLCV